MENHAHFISCKLPHKNHSREYFGTTLCLIQIATSVVEKSQILSVAFHLSATVSFIIFECVWTLLSFELSCASDFGLCEVLGNSTRRSGNRIQKKENIKDALNSMTTPSKY